MKKKHIHKRLIGPVFCIWAVLTIFAILLGLLSSTTATRASSTVLSQDDSCGPDITQSTFGKEVPLQSSSFPATSTITPSIPFMFEISLCDEPQAPVTLAFSSAVTDTNAPPLSSGFTITPTTAIFLTSTWDISQKFILTLSHQYSQETSITAIYTITTDTDGDGIDNSIDIDDDNDGIIDLEEGDRSQDTDTDGVVDSLDLDSDNDGIHDIAESGLTQVRIKEVDANDDGKIDLINSFGPTDFGVNGLAKILKLSSDPEKPDYNQDGIADSPNDTDGDDTPDWRDLDSDGDGFDDATEAERNDDDGDGYIGISPIIVNTSGQAVDTNNKRLTTSVLADKNQNEISDSYEADHDGDGIPNDTDLDDDNDGIIDLEEGDDLKDTDQDTVPDYLDLDSDNDGINDIVEAGFTIEIINQIDPDDDGQVDIGSQDNELGQNGIVDAIETSAGSGTISYDNGDDKSELLDTDNDGIPDFLDRDSDNDGINDVAEASLYDDNNDGVLDFDDSEQFNKWGQVEDVDGILLGLVAPIDVDEDGALTWAKLIDIDGDGAPNWQDLDSDGDHKFDVSEAGFNNDATSNDANDDGIIGLDEPLINMYGQAIDDSMEQLLTQSSPTDVDNDGTPEYLQADHDGDGVQNNDDLDDDNDGITDSYEMTEQGDERDTDSDGIPDHLDLDSDNDGINDIAEAGFTAATISKIDPDDDGQINFSAKEDKFGTNGLADELETALESGVVKYNANNDDESPLDTDDDALADWLDIDSDGDGVNDVEETLIDDPDKDGLAGEGPPEINEWGQIIDDEGLVSTNTPFDANFDGVPDYLDPDSRGIPQLYLPIMLSPPPMWRQVSSRLAGRSIDIVEVVNDQWVIAGSRNGEGLFYSSIGSVCAGSAPFSKISSDILDGAKIRDAAVSNNNRILIATQGNGIYYIDGGASSPENWTPRSASGLSNLFVYNITFGNDLSTAYAATDDGVYKSTDSGVNWSLIDQPIPQILNMLHFEQPNQLWVGSVGINSETAGHGLYVLDTINDQYTENNNGLDLTPKGREIWDLFVADNTVYVATLAGVFARDDDSSPWSRVGSDDVSALSLFIWDEYFYVGLIGNGIRYREIGDDSQNWQEDLRGIPQTSVRHFQSFSLDTCTGLLAATDDGVWVLK